MKKLLLAVIVASLAGHAMAYSVNGDSDTYFILKCKDGTTNKSSVPPNDNTARAFCKDHGGLARGYPKKNTGTMQRRKASSAVNMPAEHSNDSQDKQHQSRLKH